MYHKDVRSYFCTMLFLMRFSTVRWCTRHNHTQKLWLRLAMSYIPYATSPKEQTGHIIKFAHFEEENV